VTGEPGGLDEIDALVELAGGVDGPYRWATAALARGLPYVTANKALLATHGGELADIAASGGGALLASASVGGATPMLEVAEHLAASARITRLRGLVNATTTFILAAMAEGSTYGEALAEAQAAGYAEADPSLDVDGRDAAQKLAILAWVTWGEWRHERDVETTGITDAAVRAGSVVRLVAEATRSGMRVAPTEIEPSDQLATVTGAVTVRGPGAGGVASAGAVYADLARLVRGERPIIGQPPARRPVHA
jgi:homoserine dehydrogenase